MAKDSKKIQELKDYFAKRKDVLMAFLFGSRAKRISRKISDWDIGVYFRSKEYLELESQIKEYPGEDEIWGDLVDILNTDNVDLVVLNRARPDLVYTVLKEGIPLIIRDKSFFFDLLCKTSYEAIDWLDFVFDFWKIGEKAKSLTLEAKKKLLERLRFLEKEFSEIELMKKITWKEYQTESLKEKAIERWVERLIMASIDIAEIILASEKSEIPESYKDILKKFTLLKLKFPEKEAEDFSEFAKLRNILAHEYLDVKWAKIKKFVKKAQTLYPKFIKETKKLVRK